MTAPIRAPVSVDFKATGVEQVRSGLRMVGKESDQNLQRVGNASRQIAGGVESIARAGKLTGDGLKQILAQGAEIAFTFGAAGPVVGALAIVGLAIYEHITGKMKEARDEARKFGVDVNGLARGKDLTGVAKLSQRYYSGDAFAVQGENKEDETDFEFQVRQLGVTGIRQKIAELTRTRNEGIGMSGEMTEKASRAAEEMKKWAAALTTVEKRATAAYAVVEKLAKLPDVSDTLNLAGQRYQNRQEVLKQIRENAVDFLNNLRTSEGVQTISPAAHFITRPEKDQAANLLLAGLTVPESKAPIQTAMQRLAKYFADEVQIPLGEIIRSGMAETIGSAIADGITAGFEGGGITGAFKAAGKAILAGLGGIISQMGQVWVTYGISMTALGQALWNPLTSGPAAIAIGASLIALGSALGAVAHGGSGAAGGGSSSSMSAPPQIIDRGLIDPTRALIGTASGMVPRSAVNVTVIGPNDPVAQRQIQEIIRNGNRRGSIG